MKAKLLRDCKPFGRTGDIVEVSPSAREWLLNLGMAVAAEEIGEQAKAPEKAEEKNGTKKPARAAKGRK